MKQAFFKLGFFVILYLTNITIGISCWQGCVVDKCSGKPLANYPITYCDPNANGGIGGCTTFTTGADGCFSYSGAVGSSIQIGGTSSTYYGGPCIQLGSVGAYAIKGALSIGNTVLHQGDPLNIGVFNHQIHGCNDNNLGFGYTAPGIDLSNYCIKVEIYGRGKFNETLIEVIDWTPYVDRDGKPNFNFSSILDQYPSATYRIRVLIKCCNEADPTPQSGYSVFSGNFVWNANISVGDVEFNWIGSGYTETVNNDGNPGDHQHPNDGNVYFLGQLTSGVNWNIVAGSGAVTQVKTKLFQILGSNCNGEATLIWQRTWTPVNGILPANFSFNAETGGYFFTGTDYTVGVTCFRFEVEVIGSPNCPSLKRDGYFRIAPGNIFGLVSNNGGTNSHKASTKEYSDGDLETRAYTSLEGDIHIFPNPVNDRLIISGIDQIRSATIIGVRGEKVHSTIQNGTIDVSHLTGGIYILIIEKTSGETVSKRFVKI